MPQDTYGTGSIAEANRAPKGAFGNDGGVKSLRDGSPASGSPPNTQPGQIELTPAGQGGVHAMRDGSPASGSPPNTQRSQLEASFDGGPQGIPADRAPESGDGTGQ